MTDKTRYGEILAQVEATATKFKRSGQVRLVAVSKAQPIDRLLDVRGDGCRLFGENYAQEFLNKADRIPDVEWHFIGHLQTNKVKAILPKTALIHSVDRESLLNEVNRRAEQQERTQPILIEVNVGNEETKSGVSPESLRRLVEKALLLPFVKLSGLMAIPPFMLTPEEARGSFRQIRMLRDDLENEFRVSLPELSMGMSSDFEVAIQEGATLVRVGTAIFGPRSYR